MIRVRQERFLSLAKSRGYSAEQVAGSIAQDHGDGWLTVDERHRAYPHAGGPVAPHGGAGTELKKLLAGFPLYIKVTPSCPCNQRAKHMDNMGCDWCEENLPTIVEWLKEEHAKRKMLMPFSEVAVTQLVKFAIRRARKKGTCQ